MSNAFMGHAVMGYMGYITTVYKMHIVHWHWYILKRDDLNIGDHGDQWWFQWLNPKLLFQNTWHETMCRLCVNASWPIPINSVSAAIRHCVSMLPALYIACTSWAWFPICVGVYRLISVNPIGRDYVPHTWSENAWTPSGTLVWIGSLVVLTGKILEIHHRNGDQYLRSLHHCLHRVHQLM